MSWQRQGPVYADIERKKEEARQIRANRAAQLSEEEKTPPPSLFDLPVKRETDDVVSTRAKNLLGCYDSVKSSIQTQSRDLIGVRSGPQTPGLPPHTPLFAPPDRTSHNSHQKQASSRQRSSSNDKRRSRSHSNEDNRHSNQHSSHQVVAKQRENHGNKDSKVGKEHHKDRHQGSGDAVVKETSRPSNKPNLPHLKIKEESKSWLSDSHPPVDHILQEMKSIDQPLTAIHTPRKDDCKFPFHREDPVVGKHNNINNTKTSQLSSNHDRANIFTTISSKPTSKLKNLEDSEDSDSDGEHTKPKSSEPSSNMSSKPLEERGSSKIMNQASLSSSSDSGSSDSSGSDSDSSSDDDDDVAPTPKRNDDPADDPNKLSWSIDSLMQNMKKTSPGSILDTSASENPPSNPSQQLSPPLVVPPLISPLEGGRNVSGDPDPLMSSSDMDISDVETKPTPATPVRRRSSSRGSRERNRNHRLDTTPKRPVRTKAERKIRVRHSSESSDEDVDVEATTPVKQSQIATQASKLKLVQDQSGTPASKLKLIQDQSVTQASKLKLMQDQSHKRHRRRRSSKLNHSDVNDDVNVKDVSDVSEKTSSSHNLLNKVKYVNGKPTIMVQLKMALIRQIPTKRKTQVEEEPEVRSPEVRSPEIRSPEVERALPSSQLAQDMDVSSSENESESESKPAADVPTAVSPIKTPSQLPSLSQLPKIPKRKHPESPEGGASKRSRSHASLSHTSADQFTRSPSPDRSQDPYTKLARPQWLDEHTTASNSSSTFSKLRDWDAPTQTSFRSSADMWGAVVAGQTKIQETPPSQEVDPFRAEDQSPSANNYLEDARKLKHQADKLNDILTKSLTYLESALCFIQCGNAMEDEQALNPNPSMTAIQKMYKDTLALIRRILRGRVSDSGDKEGKLHVLSNRIQAILHLKLFKLGKKEAMKLKQIIDDYSKSQSKPSTIGTQAPSPYGSQGWPRSSGTPSPISPSPSPASVGSVSSQCSDMAVSRLTTGHYSSSSQTGSGTTPTGTGNGSHGSSIAIPQRIHSVTQQYITTLNNLYLCHDLWDQADLQASLHKDFFRELDHHCGELTLHSSILSLVKYVRLGLHRLKDT